MFRSTILVIAALAFTCTVSALPLAKRAFALQDYADFQISSGAAGGAKAAAEAVFVTPFAGQDLAAVTEADLDNLNTMAKAAVAEEAKFNTALESATGDAETSLQAGKIANKVLKLTGEIQVLNVKAAQGDAEATAEVAAEQKKLDTNIALDVKSKGVTMTPA